MASAYGQPQSLQSFPASKDMGEAADGMMGVVVNQTLTPIGYEFYRIFSILWSEKPDSGDYSLNIKERLSKRYGNRVEVYLGQKLMYAAVLPFKYDGLHTLCEKAVEDTQTNIAGLIMQVQDNIDIVRD
jgi:curli production assembly/transport component CsgE